MNRRHFLGSVVVSEGPITHWKKDGSVVIEFTPNYNPPENPKRVCGLDGEVYTTWELDWENFRRKFLKFREIGEYPRDYDYI